MRSQIDFGEVVHNHSHWKFLLKKAIESGQCELSVAHVRDVHHCAFGRWLHSSAGRSLPNYSEVVELHQRFHEEAANVLELALQRHFYQASEQLKLGSRFSQASANLISKLSDVRETIENSN